MGVIYHYARPVLPGKADYLRQVGNIAAHAEYAVRYYEAACGVRYLLQLLFKVSHVPMAVAQHSRLG